jgi:hypothetical protein
MIMLATSREGEAHSIDTYRKLLEKAGFSRLRFTRA